MIKELISSASNEILGILPSFDAFQRQVDAGMFDHIRNASRKKTYHQDPCGRKNRITFWEKRSADRKE